MKSYFKQKWINKIVQNELKERQDKIKKTTDIRFKSYCSSLF